MNNEEDNMKGKVIACFLAIALSITLCWASWAASSKTIKLATLNWPPFYSEDLPENGFFTAISREAFKRAGYTLDVQFTTWNEALEMAKKGNFDGVLGAYHSSEREQSFDFTDPIATNEEVFFAKKGSGITYQKVEDLKKYKVGALKGGIAGNELREMGMTVVDTGSDLDNFKKLNQGGIGLYLFGKQNFYYQIANSPEWKPLADSVEMVEPPYKTYDMFCALTKKMPNSGKIVEEFNKALEEMKTDGTYEKILKRFNQ
jgi:polar amino acid transport system substrate-binding protein